eukprot:403340293
MKPPLHSQSQQQAQNQIPSSSYFSNFQKFKNSKQILQQNTSQQQVLTNNEISSRNIEQQPFHVKQQNSLSITTKHLNPLSNLTLKQNPQKQYDPIIQDFKSYENQSHFSNSKHIDSKSYTSLDQYQNYNQSDKNQNLQNLSHGNKRVALLKKQLVDEYNLQEYGSYSQNITGRGGSKSDLKSNYGKSLANAQSVDRIKINAQGNGLGTEIQQSSFQNSGRETVIDLFGLEAQQQNRRNKIIIRKAKESLAGYDIINGVSKLNDMSQRIISRRSKFLPILTSTLNKNTQNLINKNMLSRSLSSTNNYQQQTSDFDNQLMASDQIPNNRQMQIQSTINNSRQKLNSNNNMNIIEENIEINGPNTYIAKGEETTSGPVHKTWTLEYLKNKRHNQDRLNDSPVRDRYEQLYDDQIIMNKQKRGQAKYDMESKIHIDQVYKQDKTELAKCRRKFYKLFFNDLFSEEGKTKA